MYRSSKLPRKKNGRWNLYQNEIQFNTSPKPLVDVRREKNVTGRTAPLPAEAVLRYSIPGHMTVFKRVSENYDTRTSEVFPGTKTRTSTSADTGASFPGLLYLPVHFNHDVRLPRARDLRRNASQPLTKPCSNPSSENFSTAVVRAASRMVIACEEEREKASCIADANSCALLAWKPDRHRASAGQRRGKQTGRTCSLAIVRDDNVHHRSR